MTICRFYQQGSCNYGDRCRFEHIKPQNYQQNQQHQQDRYRQPASNQNSSTGGFSFTRTLQQQSNESSFSRQGGSNQNSYQNRPPQYNQQNYNQQNYNQRNYNQQNYNQQNYRQDYRQQNYNQQNFNQQQNQRQYQSNNFNQQRQQQPSNASGFSFMKAAQSAQSTGSFGQVNQVSSFGNAGASNQFQQAQPQQVQWGTRNQSMSGSFTPAPSNSFFTQPSGFSFASHASSPQTNAQTSGGFTRREESMGENASTSDKISNESVYSQLSNLSRQEVECFESDSFCFTRIPVKPPPAQLCT